MGVGPVSPPLVRSIIFLRIPCELSRVSAIAMKAQSLMKSVESSHLPLAISMRSVL